MAKDPRIKLRKIKTRQPFQLEEGAETYVIATRHGAAETGGYQVRRTDDQHGETILVSRDAKVFPVR